MSYSPLTFFLSSAVFIHIVPPPKLNPEGERLPAVPLIEHPATRPMDTHPPLAVCLRSVKRSSRMKFRTGLPSMNSTGNPSLPIGVLPNHFMLSHFRIMRWYQRGGQTV